MGLAERTPPEIFNEKIQGRNLPEKKNGWLVFVFFPSYCASCCCLSMFISFVLCMVKNKLWDHVNATNHHLFMFLSHCSKLIFFEIVYFLLFLSVVFTLYYICFFVWRCVLCRALSINACYYYYYNLHSSNTDKQALDVVGHCSGSQ